MDPLLRADKISFSYQANQVILKDISFSLEKGEILGVLGPNGGGKSTLMKIIAGLLKPTAGEVFFAGKSVNEYKTYPYNFFSYVPQTSELNASLPVKVSEYMDFTFSLHKKNPTLNLDNNTIDRLLELVGIAHKKNERISELSGGEKQRVLIARALIQKPLILLLDEPTKGLDSNGQDQLLGLLDKIRNQDKTAIMIVDHNINQIIRSCHKILCLNRSLHWHDHRDFLTKNVLENVYHCEFEHLLIHDKDEAHGHDHQFCDHDHSTSKTPAHPFLRRRE
jgi:zinc transport system ATP-binding protein